LAARCGREGLQAGEGRGRWALGGCTRDGDRVGLSQLDGVQCCGLPELPAAEDRREDPQSSRAEAHVHESREGGGLAQLFVH
jgi:hypothetical protein